MKTLTWIGGLGLGLGLWALPAQAFFILPCAQPVVVERADPIVDAGKLSDHVHTVMGGNGFNFSMDYEQARASSCSTCKVTQDLSNYWIPNLYYQREDGKFEDVPQAGGMLVYYLQRADPEDPEYDGGLVAFPEGFRMLAGDPMLRRFNGTLEQKAISYACLGVSGPETNEIPNHNCPNGLRAQVVFPSCWDGENLDSPDHRSHMAYPEGVDSGRCPDSHPKRTITLFYEVLFQVDEFKDRWHGDSQPFVLSNGDPTGYGLHGDFVNGWDIDVLQTAITNCTDNSGSIEACDVFEFFQDDVMNGCTVLVQVDERTSGVLDKLPGCNPVQDGPDDASQETGCGAPTEPSPPRWPYTDMTGSHGFRYLGCARDAPGQPRTLDGSAVAHDNMTVPECLGYCEDEGYRYAGLEFARECFCGDSVEEGHLPVKGVMGACELPCAGDEGAICGGYGALSLYEKCGGNGACANVDLV